MALDKVTGEKLPNGDISVAMAALMTEIAKVGSTGETVGLTLKDKGHFLAVAKVVTDALEAYTKLYGKQIAEAEETFEYADLGMKVGFKHGGNMSEISNEVLDELNLAEIKKVVKVTEKSLKEIGHEDLIPKYKVITGAKANSVLIGKLV